MMMRLRNADRLKRVLAEPGWWLHTPAHRGAGPDHWRNRFGTWWVNKVALMGWPKAGTTDEPERGE